ncbi:hypothetical protein LV89_02801 [Arcicella aurantiaca]|uniref:Uncharacterized protein n=1 Tax=Arcicella aurantiaca TaxID=591202 RepID=A0A316E4Z1_9BACT|nr:hypothetical protein [Arcicella aurantiaca]PWK25175.1 hypothetical protein LV89_02801 [Arcicella aurantiaca]
MQKSKTFILILFLFVVALVGALYWFENQESSIEENEYIALPDSLIQQIKTNDSLEKAEFLNVSPPKLHETTSNEKFFEQKKEAYTFQLFRDSTGVKLVVLFGTQVIGESHDKSLSNANRAETSDLNSDGYPEILVYSKKNSKLTFIGFEAQNGLQKFVLPQLMGRQSFGYAGQDTLFIENNNLVRRFQFRNAQFSAFPSGTRTCEYALGHDLRFTMVRTLDTE